MQLRKNARNIIFVALLAFIVALLCLFSTRSGDTTCRNTEPVIKDSLNAQFVSKKEIMSYLDRCEINPYGQSFKNIDLRCIEKKLEKHLFIKEAQCYFSPNGTVNVEIRQRKPVLRVSNGSAGGFYIDKEGKKFPLSTAYAAYVPIASGEFDLTEDYVRKNLLDFVVYIDDDKFWRTQIEQIYVQRSGVIELIPRVGDNVIILGTTENYRSKLKKLRTLYDEAFSKIGWSKYSKIDLRYKGQVVCTKRGV
ncbi:MAG: hypothetical protein MJZ19_04205 [Paludibacteraceae bacterium]|nr:hypothetical protein [Paludibacteraceae bacterium]